MFFPSTFRVNPTQDMLKGVLVRINRAISLVLFCLLATSLGFAEECEQIKCLSGLTLIDSGVEVTGGLLVDKGVYLVESSTPTAHDTRAIIWLEETDGDLKIVFPNGQTRVLAEN